MKRIVTDDYEFENLIRNRAVYVDKTDLLARLASGRMGSQFFIARPRRFGKSLMLSTLRHMFEGHRNLFKGLKIEKTRWDWSKTYPVLHLDMQTLKSSTVAGLEKNLYGEVQQIARNFGLEVPWEYCSDSGKAFAKTLAALGQKGPFVVLIDEYDVPLQGFLGSREIVRARRILHDFYSAFKANVGSIRFLMMTGVSKFAKLSVFSSLNNLTDLTIEDGRFAGLLGYTRAEVKAYFSDQLTAFGRKLGKTPAEIFRLVLAWYDSYRFSPYSKVKVINPVALGQAFSYGHFGSFWSSTGMPTLILERLAASGRRPDQLESVTARISDLDVCDAEKLPWLPLLYQAGYLTIKDVTWETAANGAGIPQPVMTLGVPNLEVRSSLSSQWWNTLMQIREGDFTALVHEAERLIAAGDIEKLLIETLYSLYAKLPPTWAPKTEQDAKRHFLLFMEMAGAKMQPEKPTCRGFADAVVETGKGVWVMEFKYNRSAASAIRQIRERGYADAWKDGDKPVTLIGIKFDSARKNITLPKFEPLTRSTAISND